MAKKTGTMKLYKSYMFRSKDPAIDELRTVMQDHFGELNAKSYQEVEESGGPSANTIYEWFHGKTKRPQNATLEAAGRALGMKRVWVRNNNGPANGTPAKKKGA